MFSVFQLCQPSQNNQQTNINQLEGRIRPGKEYLVAIGLSVLTLVFVMRLWNFDMNVPMSYMSFYGDDLLVSVWSKTIYEEGWYMWSPRLGAPFGLHMGDFPMADGFHQFLYKILGWFSPNYVFALNLFFLLTFPLTTASSLFVLKRFGMGTRAAIASSLLFSFLPYKFFRNISHLYLSSYYIVPLSVLTILWVYLDRIAVFGPKSDYTLQERRSRRWRWLGSMLICAIQGASGVYYAFFACYLLLIAGLASTLTQKRLYPLYTAMTLVTITCVALLFNLSPHLVYQQQEGKNPTVAARNPIEAELFGLKISHLLLPAPNHRFAPFAKITENYRSHSLPPLKYQENQWSSLGIIGAGGLLVLLIILLKQQTSKNEIVNSLAKLNFAAILLGTIGGFSTLFALFASPMIRGYNRISIYIAFFSFFMVGIMLDRFGQFFSKRAWASRGIYTIVLLLVVVVGIADQVPSSIYPFETYPPRPPGERSSSSLLPQYAHSSKWTNDARFFGEVAASLPDNSAVMQFPHMTFPECPPVHLIGTYDNCRGFLHTSGLRWSYPMRGRKTDMVLQKILKEPLNQQIRELAFLGFNGIYIDRRGYLDGAVGLETELTRLLGRKPIVSEDQTMSFYSMVDYSRKLKNTVASAEWHRE